MHYQLITISLILFTCNAQEHLTCLRTDDVINPSPQPTPSNIKQGRPGRRGPRGPRGKSGLPGLGVKGEPGISDNSQINSLRDNFTRALLRGYMELDDGWIAPFNGYQYKATSNALNWDDSRINCKILGGDLIDYGFRDLNVITKIFNLAVSYTSYIKKSSKCASYNECIHRIISDDLTHYLYKLNLVGRQNNYSWTRLPRSWCWIGLSNKAIQGPGDWRWLNGQKARLDDASLWLPNQPSGVGVLICAASYLGDNHRDGFRVGDNPCSIRYKAICEKLVVS